MRKSFKTSTTTSPADLALHEKLKNLGEENFDDEDDDTEPKGSYLTKTLGSNRKYFKNTKISQQIEYLEGFAQKKFTEVMSVVLETFKVKPLIKNRTHKFSIYKQCFIAQQAIDGVLEINRKKDSIALLTREKCVLIFQVLVELGVIVSLPDGKKPFEDKYLFFRFNEQIDDDFIVKVTQKYVEVSQIQIYMHAIETIEDFYEKVNDPSNGFDKKDRVVGKRTHIDSVIGSVVIDWIESTYKISRSSALLFARYMQKAGVFLEDQTFKDDEYYLCTVCVEQFFKSVSKSFVNSNFEEKPLVMNVIDKIFKDENDDFGDDDNEEDEIIENVKIDIVDMSDNADFLEVYGNTLNEDHFWVTIKEKDNIEFKENEEIKSATLTKLIEILTGNKFDQTFFETFFLTHSSFTTSEVVLKKLMERLNTPQESPFEDLTEEEWILESNRIKNKTKSILHKWVMQYFYDWNPNMISTMSSFIDEVLSKEDGNLAANMRKVIGLESFHHKGFFDSKISSSNNQKYLQNFKLDDLDELELAKQLTLLEYSIFTQIKPNELLGTAWTKISKETSNVQKSSFHFNQLSSWISSYILEEQNLKKRRSKLQRGYQIAIHLYNLKNFDSFLAVASGLKVASIFRLKKTFHGLDSKLIKEFEQMFDVMDPKNSYSAYREQLEKTKPPLVPYLGIYLTDLTFIEDGNKDILLHSETQKPLINWTKKRMMSNVIKKIIKYQNKSFMDIQPNDQAQGLLNSLLESKFPTMNEMYQMSLQVEPRDKK
eukprot:gene1961-1469_t